MYIMKFRVHNKTTDKFADCENVRHMDMEKEVNYFFIANFATSFSVSGVA